MGRPGRLRITLACGDYDRTRALHTGAVSVDGVDLRVIGLPASEIFLRMSREGEFDVAEMSLSMFLIGLSRGDDRFVGLPVFPLRAFRHRDIYISGLNRLDPWDLRGRAIGLRHFHMTSAVWQRGILSDDYAVGTDQIRWVRAEPVQPGPAVPRMRLLLPEAIQLSTVADRSLLQLLESGELAGGLFASSPPPLFAVRRLFDDPRAVELAYHRRTRIYPIMHLLVARRELLRAHPWLTGELVTAFEAAKRAAYDAALAASSPSMLPFHVLDLERDRADIGSDLYPYGLQENITTLETFRRYSIEQSLTYQPPPVANWFNPDADVGTSDAGERVGHREVED